jgi:predicted DsbA family dithiol-disulfide isomerase
VTERYIKSGEVQLAFRHLPLKQIHPWAEVAAQAALCAGAQGRFWDMHASLFEDQASLDGPSLLRRARTLGLDEPLFESCVSGTLNQRIALDVQAADDLQLRSTPTFLVGLRRSDGNVDVKAILPGARSAVDFSNAIEPLLQPVHSKFTRVVMAGAAVLAVLVVTGAGVARRRRRLAVLAPAGLRPSAKVDATH